MSDREAAPTNDGHLGYTDTSTIQKPVSPNEK